MINEALFSSASEDWETPQTLFDRLNALFAFELDVCATPENAKCERFYTKVENGLVQPWCNRNWMNPPYGRTIGEWVSRADTEATEGRLTVSLLPARVDTKWFHMYCTKWHFNLLQGRLKFKSNGHELSSAPFPSMLVYFGIPRI